MDKIEVQRQVYEAKSMTECILQGYSETETANEFNVNRVTVRRRLKMLGYTYSDLVELREARKNKQGS